MSILELEFLNLWQHCHRDLHLERELLLIPTRRFRFDFCHLPSKVAIEINGQIYHKGGHSSGSGLMRDYEKLNLAQSLGWCVFQLSSKMIDDYWINIIATTIKTRLSTLVH